MRTPIRRTLASALLLPCLVLLVLVGLIGPPEASASTRWHSPLGGRLTVVAPFAPGAADWDPGHRGVDLSAAGGDAVLSAGEGTVAFAGDLAGRGVMSIDHGGLRTTYEPVDPVVSVGEHVAAGELIGYVSATGGHCRCLHWGLKRGRTYFDPLTLLRRIILKPA